MVYINTIFTESSFPQWEVKVGGGGQLRGLALPQKRGRKAHTYLVGVKFKSTQCKAISFYERSTVSLICLKLEILIFFTWIKYTKKNDGMINMLIYGKSNVRMRFL